METSVLAPADRKSFIGGSDAPGVLGCSRWETPISVWARKTGEVVTEREETLPMRVGKIMEDGVAELFAQETGLKVRRVNESRVHPKYPFLAAQIDRLVVGEESVLECKTASGWKAKEWDGEEIPQEYIIQALHQLAVTGRKRAYVAVLIGGNQDFKIKKVERDDGLIAQMVTKEVAFWNDYVIPKVMPKVVTKDDGDILYQLFPKARPGATINLGDQGAKLIEMRNALYQDQIQLEKQIDQIENEVKALMQTHEIAEAGKWIVTWKDQITKRLDSKALKAQAPQTWEQFATESASRVFRVKEVKG